MLNQESTSQIHPQAKELYPMAIINGEKVFGLNIATFNNFDEFIRRFSDELNVEYEIFFSNVYGDQWGVMYIKNGKVTKTQPLIAISIKGVKKVIVNGSECSGYLVEYSGYLPQEQQVYVPDDDVKKLKLLPHFSLPPPTNKKLDPVCNRLLKELILVKAETGDGKDILIGRKQGWNIISVNQVCWESKGKYSEYASLIDSTIPKGILSRNSAENNYFQKDEHYRIDWNKLFDDLTCLKIPLLIRTASYMLSFAQKYNEYFNQLIYVNVDEDFYYYYFIAIYDNVSYGKGEVLFLSDAKKIEYASQTLNDAILLVVDDTKMDECKKRENGMAVLRKIVLDSRSEFLKIPVLLSRYPPSEIPPDLYCDFSIQEALFPNIEGIKIHPAKYSINIRQLTELLVHHDHILIQAITERYSKFIEIFDSIMERVSYEKPHFIPKHRMNVFHILSAVSEIYGELFGEFFDDDTLNNLINILGNYDETGTSNDEALLISFGKTLNEELDSERFNLINRTKFITFDKGTDSLIIDDDYVYFETELIKELAKEKLKLNSVNSLTNALKINNCLTINDHNSNCYRFHLQTSDGVPYMLYTYGISKKLINAENRKRFDLANMENFLLSNSDFKNTNILPLGITCDGSLIGKDISAENKSNDSIFITGQSGTGKTFCATQLLPSLAALGNNILIIDTSGSFTLNEVLRALPENIVDTFFEFMEVDVGKGKFPVDFLYIGDCVGLPAKKRRIMRFIKAAAGKISKNDTRIKV